VLIGIEFAAHEAGYQAGKGGTDLVGARGEELPDQADDPGLDTRDLPGNFEEVGASEEPRLHIVLPGDAKKVGGIHIPETHTLQLGLLAFGDARRIAHLREGGNDDAPLAAALRRALDDFGVEGLHDSGHG